MDIATLTTSFEFKIFGYLAHLVLGPFAASLLIMRLKRYPATSRQMILSGLLIVALTGATTVFSVARLSDVTSAIPTVSRTLPAENSHLEPSTSNIILTFNAPVLINNLRINTNPSVPLVVNAEKYLGIAGHIAKTIRITPKTSFPPGESVMLYVANIVGPLSKQYGGEKLVEFKSHPLPSITSITPGDGSHDIATNAEFLVVLDGNTLPTGSWDAYTVPPHPVTLRYKNATILSVTPDEPFKQNTTYAMSFTQTPVTLNLVHGTVLERKPSTPSAAIRFTTVKPAIISSFLPEGSAVRPSDPITIVFDEPIDTVSTTANIRISPSASLSASARWSSDSKTLTLNPMLSKNTDYSVTLGKGIRTKRGGVLEDGIQYRFKTAGPVTVIKSSPSASTSDTPVNTPIIITFDQDVDSKSAVRSFGISPVTDADFSWDNPSTMRITPKKPLAFNTLYTITMTPGIQSIYGSDSKKQWQNSFRTVAEEVMLDVPYTKQEELFTCNIAAARMLLLYRGVTVTEKQLKALIGSIGSRGNGNPYKTHVAEYGTYWDAVSRGVGQYRPFRIIKNWSLQQLLSEIKNGNPVMIWGQNGWSDPHEISWTSSDGVFIYAVNGMHSYLVRGYRGDFNSPTHILVNDPWRGQYAMTTEEFMRRGMYFRVAMAID